MAEKDKKRTRWRRYGQRTLIAGVLLFVGSCTCCWYVHLPYDVQVRNYDRYGFLLVPVEALGEFTTQFTDVLGLTGIDATVPIPAAPEKDEFFYGGVPVSTHKVEVLGNTGYYCGYSEERKDPLWVAYRVFKVDSLSSPPRPNRFTIDKRTHSKVAHDAYTRSGYDRGHMAPNFAIATRFGKPGQKETFMMSNIVPQKPDLNRKTWKKIEHMVASYYGQDCGEVWVITGPIFDPHDETLDSGVHIPDAFYKIIIDERGDRVRVMPFIFMQSSDGNEWIRRHLVSIDEIEAMTGIDFFPKLPDDVETALESQHPTRLWRPSLSQLFDMLFD